MSIEAWLLAASIAIPSFCLGYNVKSIVVDRVIKRFFDSLDEDYIAADKQILAILPELSAEAKSILEKQKSRCLYGMRAVYDLNVAIANAPIFPKRPRKGDE